MPAAFFSETVNATSIKLGTLTNYGNASELNIGRHVDFMAAILDFFGKFKNCSKSTRN